MLVEYLSWNLAAISILLLMGYILFETTLTSPTKANILTTVKSINLFKLSWCVSTSKSMLDGLTKLSPDVVSSNGLRVISFLSYKVLMVSNLDVIESVLTNPHSQNRLFMYDFLHYVSKGLFVANGDAWRTLRRIFMPSMNPKYRDYFIEVMNKHSKILNNLLVESSGKTVQINEITANCIFDISMESFFGIELSQQLKKEFPLHIFSEVVHDITLQRTSKVWLIPDFMWKKSKEYAKWKAKWSIADKIRKDKWNPAFIETIQNPKEEAYSYAPVPYAVKIAEYLEKRFGTKPTPDDVFTYTLDVILASFDTSSSVVSSLLLFLACHPEYQDKLREEILSEVGPDREPSKLELGQLKYMDMVIKETLRHIHVPAIGRQTTSDVYTPEGIIPAGTQVGLLLFVNFKDPKYWQHPNSFYPDHFLEEYVKHRPKFTYLPFSYGPRSCPGFAVSDDIMKIIIIHVLRNFKLETNVKFNEIEYDVSILKTPAGGCPVKLIPIQKH